MHAIILQYFWIRNRNPGMKPAEAWASAIQVISFIESIVRKS